MNLAIRASRPEDLPSIHAAYRHAVLHGTASWEIEPPELAEMARRRDAIIADGYPYLVAESGGAVLGYAYAGAYRPRAAYRATVEDSIYVAPEAQGAGVGGALLEALIEACAARGFRQMVAVIGDGDGGSAASARLHARAGFELVGVLQGVGFKQGRWLNQMLMRKALGEGIASPSPFA